MPVFKYRAKDGLKNVEGTIEAQTKEEAVEFINRKGYLPVRVEEQTSGESQERAGDIALGPGRVRSKDVTLFSRQLASLIRSGVPILTGLKIIADQSEQPAFHNILHRIHAQIKEGKALSSVLTAYPRLFPPIYVAMIRSGETSGTLQEVLVRIADYRQKQEEIVARIRTALAYPMLMAVVGLGTIVFMLTFVMPRLMRVFARMGQELPLPTKILLTISSAIQQGGGWFLLIFIILFLVLKRGARTKVQKTAFSRLKLQLPILRDFVRKSELTGFSRTLELLIKGGIPILKALQVAIPTLNNEILKEELLKCHKQLEEGSTFGRSLQNSKLFPGFMVSLIAVGEESGRLDEALAEIANSYERETDEALKIMTSLLEPLMILVMGVIVGLIVVAMLLPIFQMNMMTT